MLSLPTSLKRSLQHWSRRMYQRLLQWTKPTYCSPLAGTLTDFARTKAELVAENALLRQQLIILRREAQAPNVYQGRSAPPVRTRTDRQELETGALYCAA